MEKEMTFEQALNRLNEINSQIQRNDCTIDDGLKLFEEGMNLSKYCFDTLKIYEEKLKELTKEINDHDEK